MSSAPAASRFSAVCPLPTERAAQSPALGRTDRPWLDRTRGVGDPACRAWCRGGLLPCRPLAGVRFAPAGRSLPRYVLVPVSFLQASEGRLSRESLVPCSLPLSACSLSEPRALSSVLGLAEGRVNGERSPALRPRGRWRGLRRGRMPLSFQVVLRLLA